MIRLGIYASTFPVSAAMIAAFVLVNSSPVHAQDRDGSAILAADQGEIRDRKIPDTIMFTIDELNEIKDRISSGVVEESTGTPRPFEEDSLYLQSILYYSPQEWTIWVNGVPVGPQEDFQTFQVTEITPQYVQLLVPLSAQGMRPVRLEPNQTFITESGIIIEGPLP